jgi:hypothetical protein
MAAFFYFYSGIQLVFFIVGDFAGVTIKFCQMQSTVLKGSAFGEGMD